MIRHAPFGSPASYPRVAGTCPVHHRQEHPALNSNRRRGSFYSPSPFPSAGWGPVAMAEVMKRNAHHQRSPTGPQPALGKNSRRQLELARSSDLTHPALAAPWS